MSVPQDKPLRAIIWCAVSSTEQAREEKISLAEQERLLREKAESEGWLITDILIVPGFSRRFYNYPEFMQAAQEEKIDAPKRLMQHWLDRDFDVLACRYGSRFAREQSIFGEVVARTIDMGARIFTLQDGWVDKSNYRMFISMGGYAAATEVDKLVNGFNEAMTQRARQGLPVSHNVLISHKVIRNELGKAQELVVNEQRRRMFDDFADILLTGISWGEIPNLLYERGHAAPSGKPWSTAVLWRTVHSPWFWGHGARLYADSTNGKQNYGIWSFDLAVQPPPGAIVFRNTHEPMYTGEQAEGVMSELRRRSQIITGRAGYATSSPFTGLLICGSCGYRMRYKRPSNNLWEGYSCVSRDPRFRLHERHKCDSHPRTIKMSIVKEWVDARLRQVLHTHDIGALLPITEEIPTNHIDTLQAEIAGMERRIAGLMLQRLDTPPASQSILTDLILRSDEQLAILRANLDVAQRKHTNVEEKRRAASGTLAQIASLSLEEFWEQPSPVINRQLYSLLGDYRIVIQNGKIIGAAIPEHE